LSELEADGVEGVSEVEPELLLGGEGLLGRAEYLLEARNAGVDVAEGAKRFDDSHCSLISRDASSYHGDDHGDGLPVGSRAWRAKRHGRASGGASK
jgi:hypothetical protein